MIDLSHGVRIGTRYPFADQANSLSCNPLLMLSSGRAGTTLLRSMLVAGGQISIPPETQVFAKAALKFSALQNWNWGDICRIVIALFESHGNFKMWDANMYPAYGNAIGLPAAERSLARIIDEIFKCYTQQAFPEAKIWGEQSPLHTLYAPWVYKIFPRAKYLHLLRDGRDVIASMVERKYTLEYSTERWKACVERTYQLREKLAPDQFLEIRYEDLVSKPEETLQQVSSFVGIEFRQQMLDYWKLPTTVEHKYMDHHRNLSKPVFTSSIGQWKQRLTEDQQKYIMTSAADLLRKLNYLD
jgi:hypothetical protein